ASMERTLHGLGGWRTVDCEPGSTTGRSTNSGRASRVVRSALWSLALTLFVLLLASCGTTPGPGGGGGGGGGGGPRSFDGAVSQSCEQVSGLQALYWDFMLGVIRTDYPETYRLLPYVGSPFIHPAQPLYSFMYPPGWSAPTLADPS